MSERAIGFVEDWVSENIGAKGHQAESGNSQAKAFATQCLTAAAEEGISQSEIDAAFEDLTAFMAGQIEEANDREVARSAAKED
jgi:predicted metal-dependent hydrolase